MKNQIALRPEEYLAKTSQESRFVQESFLKECGQDLITAAKMISDCIHNGGKVLILGNGGSAADAQHMAAEMVGRMLIDRRPLPALALTTDSSNLTAIGNDFGIEQIFLKQIQALAVPKDIVIGISTSGNSQNVILAVSAARDLGCKVISLVGGSGGKLRDLSDLCLNASFGKNSCRIQETHIFAIHSIVDLIDRFFLLPQRGA